MDPDATITELLTCTDPDRAFELLQSLVEWREKGGHSPRYIRDVGGPSPLVSVAYVAAEGFAWPGGYQTFVITEDGALLCSSCVKDELELVARATAEKDRSGWQAVGLTHTGEMDDPEQNYCAHCNRPADSWGTEEN